MSTTGIHAETAALLSGDEHLQQSIADILSTPIGSRIMRRDYGSRLFELIDQPANPVQRLLALATVADALRRWEPRILLQRLGMRPADGATAEAQQGRFELSIQGALVDEAAPQPEPIDWAIPLTLGAAT